MYHSILAIEMYIHIKWLPVIIALSVLAGMLFRIVQLKKSRKNILSLENDMLRCHANILQLEQKLAEKTASQQPSSPIVPMKDQSSEEKKDISQRESMK